MSGFDPVGSFERTGVRFLAYRALAQALGGRYSGGKSGGYVGRFIKARVGQDPAASGAGGAGGQAAAAGEQAAAGAQQAAVPFSPLSDYTGTSTIGRLASIQPRRLFTANAQQPATQTAAQPAAVAPEAAEQGLAGNVAPAPAFQSASAQQAAQAAQQATVGQQQVVAQAASPQAAANQASQEINSASPNISANASTGLGTDLTPAQTNYWVQQEQAKLAARQAAPQIEVQGGQSVPSVNAKTGGVSTEAVDGQLVDAQGNLYTPAEANAALQPATGTPEYEAWTRQPTRLGIRNGANGPADEATVDTPTARATASPFNSDRANRGAYDPNAAPPSEIVEPAVDTSAVESAAAENMPAIPGASTAAAGEGAAAGEAGLAGETLAGAGAAGGGGGLAAAGGELGALGGEGAGAAAGAGAELGAAAGSSALGMGTLGFAGLSLAGSQILGGIIHSIGGDTHWANSASEAVKVGGAALAVGSLLGPEVGVPAGIIGAIIGGIDGANDDTMQDKITKVLDPQNPDSAVSRARGYMDGLGLSKDQQAQVTDQIFYTLGQSKLTADQINSVFTEGVPKLAAVVQQQNAAATQAQSQFQYKLADTKANIDQRNADTQDAILTRQAHQASVQQYLLPQLAAMSASSPNAYGTGDVGAAYQALAAAYAGQIGATVQGAQADLIYQGDQANQANTRYATQAQLADQQYARTLGLNPDGSIPKPTGPEFAPVVQTTDSRNANAALAGRNDHGAVTDEQVQGNTNQPPAGLTDAQKALWALSHQG